MERETVRKGSVMEDRDQKLRADVGTIRLVMTKGLA